MGFKEKVWEGKPVLESTIAEQGGKPFAFGIAKARLIVANIDTIKAFVEKHKATGKTQNIDIGSLSMALAKFGLKVSKI